MWWGTTGGGNSGRAWGEGDSSCPSLAKLNPHCRHTPPLLHPAAPLVFALAPPHRALWVGWLIQPGTPKQLKLVPFGFGGDNADERVAMLVSACWDFAPGHRCW